jgi:hypothetical protein
MMFGIGNLLQLSLMAITYGVSMRLFGLIALLFLAACNGDIFTRDGVTDGDTFYLAPRAVSDQDPVLQSWVTYSLIRSACQLNIGGENPAHASSFECECTARRHLAQAWREKVFDNQDLTDDYLDSLLSVEDAGFLLEYTARYHSRAEWDLPEGLLVNAFRVWRRQHLRHHRPRTRIIGSWGFSHREERGESPLPVLPKG